MNIEVVFIGDKFPLETGSIMSDIYIVRRSLENKTYYQKTDWGLLIESLRNKHEVLIRQPTAEEVERFEIDLVRVIKENDF